MLHNRFCTFFYDLWAGCSFITWYIICNFLCNFLQLIWWNTVWFCCWRSCLLVKSLLHGQQCTTLSRSKWWHLFTLFINLTSNLKIWRLKSLLVGLSVIEHTSCLVAMKLQLKLKILFWLCFSPLNIDDVMKWHVSPYEWMYYY